MTFSEVADGVGHGMETNDAEAAAHTATSTTADERILVEAEDYQASRREDNGLILRR